MRWSLSWRADPRAAAIADRHYNRQSPGAAQFVPPGRCIVLLAPGALWVTSWPLGQYVQHAWPGAWLCSAFRNESDALSSELIVEAERATRWAFGEPPEPHGFITFVDPSKVRRKRDPGRCFLRAGWRQVGRTKGGLVALQRPPEDAPAAEPPIGAALDLFTAGAA